jgi:hypothetical protein
MHPEVEATMDTAFMVTWKVPFPGREAAALQLGADSGEYWGKIAAEGVVSEPEWFFHPAGWGMWMVKGDRSTLTPLVHGETSREFLARGQLLLDSWQYALAETGSGADRYLAQYGTSAATLGVI